AIGADADVQLQRAHADLQRALERGQGVLGRVAARAAVPLQVEGRGGQAEGQADETNQSSAEVHCDKKALEHEAGVNSEANINTAGPRGNSMLMRLIRL